MCQASRCGFATCGGPVWRYVRRGADQNREQLKLVDPNCFSWPRPVRSFCPYRSSTSLDGRMQTGGSGRSKYRSGCSPAYRVTALDLWTQTGARKKRDTLPRLKTIRAAPVTGSARARPAKRDRLPCVHYFPIVVRRDKSMSLASPFMRTAPAPMCLRETMFGDLRNDGSLGRARSGGCSRVRVRWFSSAGRGMTGLTLM